MDLLETILSIDAIITERRQKIISSFFQAFGVIMYFLLSAYSHFFMLYTYKLFNLAQKEDHTE